MSKVLVIFIDGVGIGSDNPEANPFFKHEFKFLNDTFGTTPSLSNPLLEKDGKYLFPVDACMGVEGIPQSGTGQVSILCGINASEKLGYHFGPFPHSELYPDLDERNIFKLLMNAGKNVKFVNAYPKRFFDYLESGHKRIGSFASAVMRSGIKLNGYDEVINGSALTAEITNEVWRDRLGYKLDTITPREAAERLLGISLKNDFTLYEYFLTDHLGHGRNKEYYDKIITDIDEFLFSILNNLPDKLTLLICSDHGNLEDLSIKQHTLNPALTITAGKNADMLATRIKKLYHIQPAIMELLCE